jgi:hypothetical protein
MPPTIPLARDDQGKLIQLNLAESPHIGVWSPAGAGATTALRTIAAELAAQSCLIDILDPTTIAFLDFDGLPGMRLHTDPDAMLDAIEDLRADMEMRHRAGRSLAPTRVTVIDKAGALEFAAIAPALLHVLQSGQTVGCHVVVAGRQPGSGILPAEVVDRLTTEIALGQGEHILSRGRAIITRGPAVTNGTIIPLGPTEARAKAAGSQARWDDYLGPL